MMNDRRRVRRWGKSTEPDYGTELDLGADPSDWKRQQEVGEEDPELSDLIEGAQEELLPDIEISLDELEFEADDSDEDLSLEDQFDTQHTDGHTYNPWIAVDQGLTYTPPDDPPILGSEPSNEGLEMAAGFAPSLEGTDPDVEILPDEVDNQALDLEEDVLLVLRLNSETAHLDDVRVYVEDGIVSLFGTVLSEDDLGRVFEVVAELEGVREVRTFL